MKRNIIISGGNGNLGSAVVKKFLDTNDHVLSLIRKRTGDIENENLEEIEIDLLNEELTQKTVADIISRKKNIDIVILTVGGFTLGNIAKTSTKDIYKQYQLNFETAYNIAKPVFLQMLQQESGRIFLIGSKQGLDTSKAKGVTAYALSKSLLFSLANILNAEAQGKNVNTAVIVPGIIDTPPNRADMPDADFDKWIKPEEIAEIIYFYSSDKAHSIKDSVIKVFGNL
ncbi:MAG: SDR family NAD(P)-dependent oxidoreductase [Chitinophagales bacterium]|nr:SDR family NAD(P)-dependent oxidoreductase [Chitinophagales bacterium]